MTTAFKWRAALCALAVLVGAWYLKDSVRYYTMTPVERAAMDPEALSKLRSNSIKLGLDLQGGMHLVLRVDKSKLGEKEAVDAVERALEVIRNRVDQFGVSESAIQSQGEDRILVQLPGIQEIDKAKELIGQTALLEFKIAQPATAVQEIATKIDEIVKARGGAKAAPGDTAAAASADSADTSAFAAEMDSILQGGDEEANRPFSKYLGFLGRAESDNPLVKEEDFSKVQALLADPAVQRVVPGGVHWAWGREPRVLTEGKFRDLYLLKKTPELTGAAIQNAVVAIGLQRDNPSAPGVELTLNGRGKTVFARVTGENVGRRLAIVLDGQVHSAPNIQERIPRGVASITGGFTDSEAKILAIVLRAGALPAPIEIMEERSVGPSLGKDSIEAGVKAAWIATTIVLLFLILYYRISGLFASLALCLNLFLILAVMVWIDATLTLPGIAGLILTLGMSVDANVLINERIREELRLNKSIRAAVDAGYSRAMASIVDGNATALMTSFFLLFYGTASVKGFAVTLMIGLALSMFTAVIFTRVLFDVMISRFNLKTLSI